MTPSHTRRFFMTNYVANRVVIPLLKGRAGTRLGRRLAVIEYQGRRSGQRHQLVAQYAIKGRSVRINVGMAEQKSWWRNFLQPYPLHLWLAGVDNRATAHLVRDGDQVTVIAEIEPPPRAREQ